MAHSPIIEYVAIQFAVTNLTNSLTGVTKFFSGFSNVRKQFEKEQAAKQKQLQDAYVKSHVDAAMQAAKAQKLQQLDADLADKERVKNSTAMQAEQTAEAYKKAAAEYNAMASAAKKFETINSKISTLEAEQASNLSKQKELLDRNNLVVAEKMRYAEQYKKYTGVDYTQDVELKQKHIMPAMRDVSKEQVQFYLDNNKQYQLNGKKLQALTMPDNAQEQKSILEARLNAADIRLRNARLAYGQNPSQKNIATEESARATYERSALAYKQFNEAQNAKTAQIAELEAQQRKIENTAREQIAIDKINVAKQRARQLAEQEVQQIEEYIALQNRELQIQQQIEALKRQQVHPTDAAGAERRKKELQEELKLVQEQARVAKTSYNQTAAQRQKVSTYGLSGADRNQVLSQLKANAQMAVGDLTRVAIPFARYLPAAMNTITAALAVFTAGIIIAAKFSMDEFQKLEKPALELSSILGMKESSGFALSSVLTNFGINPQSFANQFEQMSTRIMSQPAIQQVLGYRLGLNPNSLTNMAPMDMLNTINNKIEDIPNITLRNAMRTKIMGVELGDAMRIMNSRNMPDIMQSAQSAYSPEYIELMRSMTMEWQRTIFEFKAAILPYLKFALQIAIEFVRSINSMVKAIAPKIGMEQDAFDLDKESVAFLSGINKNTADTAMGVNAVHNDIRTLIKQSTPNNRPSLYGRSNWEFGFLTNTAF